ncbi:MAG: copper oxidase [Gammaproteobacteria bacterium]|jgi:FtsP/CotA-like multicopper oxidase with cupredoxin domain|nr:copper oxidase [Gammaproteobacteria bacterium]
MFLADTLGRRDFLKLSGAVALVPAIDSISRAATPAPTQGLKADYTVRIANSQVELAPGHVLSTTTYNGQFPGPLLRFTEGRRAPGPAGLRFYHSHLTTCD